MNMRHGSIASHAPRMMSQLAKQHIQQQQQETSFITQAETDAAVTKINTMFPTASEPHIRLLLKKLVFPLYFSLDILIYRVDAHFFCD